MAQRKTNARGRGATRSGIRLKNGQYKVFDSQRIKDVDSGEDEEGHPLGNTPEQMDVTEVAMDSDQSESDEDDSIPAGRSYQSLLQSISQPQQQRPRKRRKIDATEKINRDSASPEEVDGEGIEAIAGEEDMVDRHDDNRMVKNKDLAEHHEQIDSDEDGGDMEFLDPFSNHTTPVDEARLSDLIKATQNDQWQKGRLKLPGSELSSTEAVGEATLLVPKGIDAITHRTSFTDVGQFHLKQRLEGNSRKLIKQLSTVQASLAPYVSHYCDLLAGIRTPQNASDLRNMACVHALNHVLKSRDKILKNNARQSEIGDQGFTRPKVLILVETRQMCSKYAETIATLFGPEQQENKQRFQNSFIDPIDNNSSMPEDFQELFEGNSDNNFLTAMKFTRKTLKYFSAFYQSDIIVASPLGLRRIIEHEDKKKRDHDFLSSIEIAIVDQTDAMQMQSFDNIITVFKHLNHWPQNEDHKFDINRVRQWYLDQHARYLRQTIVFSAYITPELNSLFNNHMKNVAGKLKLMPSYDGAISSNAVNGMGFKQTFVRFDSLNPSKDPDARFQFFTSVVLPSILRLPRPADGAHGVLVFIPSYFDFLRVRNYFAASTQMQNTSFGAIHDYSEVSEQRRARSHFISGRHSILLYTQRAHHFFRLRIKGVKRVVMYGLPDSPLFYEELVGGFVGTTLTEGKASAEECSVKGMFSKWDALRLERVVGSERLRSMLDGSGDTFDFV